MAEVIGIMLRRNPKQAFTIFFSWNLSAFWRRVKKLQSPWAPYPSSRNLISDLQIDTKLEVPRYTEEYLRATDDIDPYEPEIIALATKLGMNEKSKREYAEDAYNWVKNNIVFSLEVPPGGPLDVLKKGYGLCVNKNSVLAALMRVAGIPARFQQYKQEMAGGFMQMMYDEMLVGDTGKEIIQEIQKSRQTFTHGCIELFLDGEWIPADLTWSDEEEVGMDVPITQFGDSPFGKWYYVIPGSASVSETIRLPKIRFKIAIKFFFIRGLLDKVNERFNRIRKMGKKKLEEIGRDAYIESKKKFYVPPPRLISEN